MRRTLAIAGMGFVLATPIAAQTTPPESQLRAEIEKVRALEPVYLAAQAAADRVDAAANEALRARGGADQETVVVGPLHIITTSDQVEEARALWTQEWSTFEPIVGTQAALLEPALFVYHAKTLPFPYQVPPGHGAVHFVEFRTPTSDRAKANAIRSAIGGVASTLIETGLEIWAGGIEMTPTIDPVRRYRLFAQASATVAQSCAQGSIPSCWSAFGESDPAANVVSGWYDESEQRALVTAMNGHLPDFPRNECLHGVMASCRAWLAHDISIGRSMPYAPALRADLLAFALKRGGAGSLDRLVASVDAETSAVSQDDAEAAGLVLGNATRIREHLGRAADMDPEVLMALWLSDVKAGRPGPPAPDEQTRAGVVFWVIALSALATRSTRWRLG